jgi:death-on-curing protein
VTEWKWLSRQAVEIVHDEQLREHGGLPGIKDENALEAALARPINKNAYERPDVFELAAAYLFGITRNHPFTDGNKRTGWLAAYAFLRLHGYQLEASNAEAVVFVLSVAAGEISEENVAAFLRDRSKRIGR